MNNFRLELKMNLKVCEGCGALWLRAGDLGVYCRGCAQRLSEFPPVGARRRGRKRRTEGRTMVCAGGAR